MSVEGIFRKNGNIRRLKDLADAIDRDPDSVDLTSDNPVQLAALLKKFLRELPDPLLTFKLYRLFIASQCTLLCEPDHRTRADFICNFSMSYGSGTDPIPSPCLDPPSKGPARHHGSALRFPEVGRVLLAHRRRDRQQDELPESRGCHRPEHPLRQRE